jgi:hypothetical protein
MPEFDPTSKYAHLINLALDYLKVIEQAEDPSFTAEERYTLLGDRSILHDQIIAEFARLGEAIDDRADAMRRAIRIAKWYRPPEDDYDI